MRSVGAEKSWTALTTASRRTPFISRAESTRYKAVQSRASRGTQFLALVLVLLGGCSTATDTVDHSRAAAPLLRRRPASRHRYCPSGSSLATLRRTGGTKSRLTERGSGGAARPT